MAYTHASSIDLMENEPNGDISSSRRSSVQMASVDRILGLGSKKPPLGAIRGHSKEEMKNSSRQSSRRSTLTKVGAIIEKRSNGYHKDESPENDSGAERDGSASPEHNPWNRSQSRSHSRSLSRTGDRRMSNRIREEPSDPEHSDEEHDARENSNQNSRKNSEHNSRKNSARNSRKNSRNSSRKNSANNSTKNSANNSRKNSASNSRKNSANNSGNNSTSNSRKNSLKKNASSRHSSRHSSPRSSNSSNEEPESILRQPSRKHFVNHDVDDPRPLPRRRSKRPESPSSPRPEAVMNNYDKTESRSSSRRPSGGSPKNRTHSVSRHSADPEHEPDRQDENDDVIDDANKSDIVTPESLDVKADVEGIKKNLRPVSRKKIRIYQKAMHNMNFNDSVTLQNTAYMNWVRQKELETQRKAVDAKEKKQLEDDKKKEKEDKLMEAKKTYDAWKRQKDEKINRQKSREKRKLTKAEQDKLDEEAAKKKEAESIFKAWARDKQVRSQSANRVQKRKQEEEQKSKVDDVDVKKREGRKAFEAWLRHKDEDMRKRRAQELRKKSEMERSMEHKRNLSGVALEAYEAWLERKETEKLENTIENHFRRNSEPPAPWLPSNPTIPRAPVSSAKSGGRQSRSKSRARRY